MLVAGVEARSLTLAKGGGGGGERGDNHLSNTFKFFSKESRIHIYDICNIVSYVYSFYE